MPVKAQALRLARRQRQEQRRPVPHAIQQRNQAVLEHLGLAHHAANQQLKRVPGERDDLVQEASLGLIAAIERFDSERGHRVSSYALSRANGQILHFRRDRQATIRIPWRLRDLHTRGMRLQEAHWHRHGCPMAEELLIETLGVSRERWQRAVEAHWQGQTVSLDTPLCPERVGAGEIGCLLDHLPSTEVSEPDPQQQWLKEALADLSKEQQRWLLGHLGEGMSLSSLARLEGVHPVMVSRVVRTTLEQLRSSAQGANARAEANPMASRAATAV